MQVIIGGLLNLSVIVCHYFVQNWLYSFGDFNFKVLPGLTIYNDTSNSHHTEQVLEVVDVSVADPRGHMKQKIQAWSRFSNRAIIQIL